MTITWAWQVEFRAVKRKEVLLDLHLKCAVGNI